jgi:mono/diheme cytochrome c family protein
MGPQRRQIKRFAMPGKRFSWPMHSARWTSLAALTVALTATPVRAEPAEANELAARARAVLNQFCHRCHNGPGSEGGDFDMLQQAQLIAHRDGDKPLVVAGKPEESLLIRKMEKGLKREGGSMPPKEVRERPAEADVTVIRQWVTAGAPAFPPPRVERPFIPLKAVLADVRDHLKKARKDARFQRYFTLTPLYNNPKVADADLPLYRAALSKALNSLSWKGDIAEVKVVDKAGTVLAVDIRDLDWDRNRLWEEILRVYPYGLEYSGHPDADLKAIDEEVRDLSDCDLALIRADWFIATATRPPLYHTLLQLPTDARVLERRLNVDIADNFLKDKLARAAFAKSGVSGQNRLVERSPAEYGAYWKSYDFKPDNGRGSLTRFPLGPLDLFPEREHPYPRQAFVHDGGEIIFNLPNGLQAYLLVDGKDRRIDEGPIQVVSDSQNTAGTPAIVSGLSCMACHKHGMIPFKDTLNTSSAVFGDAEEKVKALYKDGRAMDRLVGQDERRFLEALEKCIGPHLRVGADKDRPLKEFAEPIGELAHRYVKGLDERGLDLKTIACELDLEDPGLLVRRVGEKPLKALGLDAVLRGGIISRQEWEAVDGTSLMQEVARGLGATPSRTVKKSE